MNAHKNGMSWADAAKFGVSQYSTILGSVAPRPHMKRMKVLSILIHHSSISTVPSS